jgi:Rubisco accumulation factor 1 alpha helical domain
MSKEQLDYFNIEAYAPDCLMELRFLDSARRIECARYIADQQLGPAESAVAARAMKEHQRRPESNMGFTEAAGDCLAFKYFRDAEETKNATEKDACVGGVLSSRLV